ncbi:MAG: gluconate 2-dehydrogenase subunit 3 family protein [Burkholderiaceae bacterium]
MHEAARYPGYDVLAKRDTLSWDALTRQVIAKRLAAPQTPRFLTAAQWSAADAFCRRIVPQTGEPDAVSLVAQLDAKLFADHGAGFRDADMPYMREAWQWALDAIDVEAKTRHGHHFAALDDAAQDALITLMQHGELGGDHWRGMDPQTFFRRRVLVDVPPLYYSMPKAWNEIGFGGPASPRGYVRLEADRLDPWEATQAVSGDEQRVARKNRDVG